MNNGDGGVDRPGDQYRGSDQPRRYDDSVPTNHELAQRTQRIENKVGHVGETVDRIEEQLSEEHAEIAEQVEEHERKLSTIWPAYRLLKWLIPILLGSGALITYWQFFFM